MSRRHGVGPLAVGGGIAALLTAAVAAARHAHPAEVSPVSPTGAWKGVWVGTVVAAVVLYALGWLVTRRNGARLVIVVTVAVVVQTVPLFAPLLLSKDAYLYWAVARIEAVHRANPYVATIDDFPHDASASYPSESWRGYPAAYGPAWETLGVVPGVAAGASAWRAQLFYRIFAVIGILGMVWLLARRGNVAGVVLLGWCPLVALHYAGSGHSDAWMMLALLTALVATKGATSGALWALAGAFKPIPAVLLPLELARRRARMPRRWWAGLVFATIGIAVAATAVYNRYWLTAQVVGIHRGAGYPTPLGGVHWLTMLGLPHSRAIQIAALLFVLVYLALLRNTWLTGRSRLAIAAATLVLTSTLVGPWYGLWAIALAAAEGDAAGGACAIALSAYLLLADAVPF